MCSFCHMLWFVKFDWYSARGQSCNLRSTVTPALILLSMPRCDTGTVTPALVLLSMPRSDIGTGTGTAVGATSTGDRHWYCCQPVTSSDLAALQ